MKKIVLLATLSFTPLVSAEIPKYLAAGAQDVVVPMLYADPTGSHRIAGQLYYNISTNQFKGVDNSGNAVEFNTGPQITGITAGTGLIGGGTSGNVPLSVDVGTGANQIVQLDSLGKLPSIDGSQLTNLPNSSLSNLTFPTAVNQDLLPSGGLIVDRGVNSPAGNAETNIGGNRSQVLTQYANAANVLVHSIKLNLSGSAGSELLKAYIYSDSGGSPSSIIAESDWLPSGSHNGVVSLSFSPAVALAGGSTYWMSFASAYGTSVGSNIQVKYSAASESFPGYSIGIGGNMTVPGFAFALETNALNLGGTENYWGNTYTNQLHLGEGTIVAPEAISLNSLYLTLPMGTVDPTAPAGSVYFNSGTNKLRLFDGSSWVDLN